MSADSYVKNRSLEYSARYTQIAERLFATGRISFADRNELAACEVMVKLAVLMDEIPHDTLPRDYVDRVHKAVARADWSETPANTNRAVPSWN